MIYEISREVAAELVTRGCPLPVVYGPERVNAGALTRSRIVFERDRQGGDAVKAPPSRVQRTATVNSTPTRAPIVLARALGVIVRVWASSTVAGAAVQDHEAEAEAAADQVLVALRKAIAVRHTLWGVTSARYLDAASLAAAGIRVDGLESWPGVVYELRLTIDRGVFDSVWSGAGAETVTLGTEAGQVPTVSTDYIRLATSDAEPVTACGPAD